MNLETAYTIVMIILMGLLPILSLLGIILSHRIKSIRFLIFSFFLFVPSIIIILSIIK
mgnify:CR=1 FL=1